MTDNKDALVRDWLLSRAALSEAQETEKQLRAEVIAAFFPAPKTGTTTETLADGRRLKLIHNMSYSVTRDQAGINAVLHGMNEGWLPSGLIAPKYEVSTTAYKELSDKARAYVSDYITSRPASPQLKVE